MMSFWSFPLSFILAAIYAVALALCGHSSSVSRWMQGRGGRWCSVLAIGVLVLMLMVEGTWQPGLFHHWSFIALVLLLMLPLGMTAVRDWQRRSLAAALSHTGLWLVLWGGLFGAPDTVEASLRVDRVRAEHQAFSKDGYTVPLPFELQLSDFYIDTYDDGISPRQYTSILSLAPYGEKVHACRQDRVCSVNHPVRYHGWWIYQSDYDHTAQQYVVLHLVRDPWLPVVYTGFLLLVLGALAQMKHAWHSWKVLPVALLLAALFTAISLARIRFGTLMPALRSLWFVPHIIIYMLAYALMALALVLSCIQWAQSYKFAHQWGMVNGQLVNKLLYSASSLLLIGMLCGAVWAKQAWGQYWTWDGKECWAAATWLLTIMATHISILPFKGRGWGKVLLFLLAFLAMQMTWYGVNYLPSAKYSLHTYTSQK